jgi:hypothetical protein
VPQRLAGNVVANFGTWSVNEADKTLITRVEGALNPGAEGSDAKFSVSLTGDSVQLSATCGPGFARPPVPRAGATFA